MSTRALGSPASRGGRTAVMALSVAVALVAVACSGAGSSSAPASAPASAGASDAGAASTAPTPTPGPVTLDFTSFPLWSGILGTEADGQGRDYWDKVSADYTAEHPNVTIKVEMSDWATARETLTTRVNAGNPPDVNYMCDAETHLFSQNLAPLDDVIDQAYHDDVTQSTWDLFTTDGKIRALPAQVSWNALIINADLFRERGVPIPADPDRAWTWDEFMTAVKALTFDRDGDGKTDVYGTAIAALNDDVEWSNLHYLFNRGARFMDPSLTTFTLNDDKGVAALQWLLDLQDVDKVVPPGGQGLHLNDVYQMLFTGKVAMYHGAPWVISWMESSAASGEIPKVEDLQIVQYPHDPGGEMVTDLAACGFAVFDRPEDPARTAAAKDFAAYLTSTDRLKDWKAGGYIPARLSSMDGLYDDNPNIRALLSMAPYAKFFWSRDVDILAYADPMNAILTSVLSHRATPKEALDTFVKDAQPIFDSLLTK
jgi:multiple sugar transport system substrate-binding protein